jgi:starch-binding outer membrane protein, SusD/RagB family
MNYKFIYTLATVALLASGCKKFLTKTPVNNLAVQNFYKTQDDALKGLNAAYHNLQRPGCYNSRIWMLDIIAGNSIVGAGGGTDGLETQQAASFATTSANPGVLDAWTAHWGAVLDANEVIQNVPGIDMDATLRSRIVGEAKFVRALAYFNMVRLFGKLPIIDKPGTTGSSLYVPRSDVSKVYAFIIQDLSDAATSLPLKYTGTDVGRATKGAAMGLLAKVYLTMAGTDHSSPNLALAGSMLQSVINLGIYSLNANYGDNFNVATENGPESLFEVQYTYDPVNSGFSQDAVCSMRSEFMGPRNSGITGCCGFGWNQPTAEFVGQYEQGDRRRAATIFLPGDSIPGFSFGTFYYNTSYSTTGSNVRKFLVTNFSTQTTFADDPLNCVVLRYADILLMYAEVLNEQGQTATAATYLNQVRQRAGLTANTSASQDDFRQAVWKERRMELAFEGERWFDLVRTGTAISFLKSLGSPNDQYGVGRGNISATNLLFPIPQSEIDNNPAMAGDQNPGY